MLANLSNAICGPSMQVLVCGHCLVSSVDTFHDGNNAWYIELKVGIYCVRLRVPYYCSLAGGKLLKIDAIEYKNK